MRWQFVSYHTAAPEGTAAGRQLWAVGEGLRSLGHDVGAWSWRPMAPEADVADWCEWAPLPTEPSWRSRARSIARPRAEVVRAHRQLPAADVFVADDPASWQAIADRHDAIRVSTTHFDVWADRAALRDRSPARIQDLRAQRRAVRSSDLSWALSKRVARNVGAQAVVPATIPMPDSGLPAVEEPVVGMLADWRWPPNVAAAGALLRGWPAVRERVPGARLLLAGRGVSPVGTAVGVEWLGEVPTTADLLQRLAVFAFPCDPTSGPKMKVMDAMAHGVAVVTTTAGVEGIEAPADAVAVAPADGVADRVAELLLDPLARATLARRGRDALMTGHAPVVAAQARVHTLIRAVGAGAATAP